MKLRPGRFWPCVLDGIALRSFHPDSEFRVCRTNSGSPSVSWFFPGPSRKGLSEPRNDSCFRGRESVWTGLFAALDLMP